MATTQAFRATNVIVPAAPPALFAPSAAGVAVPLGGTSWTLLVDSAGYAPGSTADLAVEYEYSGVWVEDGGAGGFTLGTFTGKSGPTSINSMNSSIGSFDNTGQRIGPYPDNVRLRVDRIPAGVLASVTVNIVS